MSAEMEKIINQLAEICIKVGEFRGEIASLKSENEFLRNLLKEKIDAK